MSKITGYFLILTLIFFLNGCSDEWDDLVDSISGSGEDNPTPIEEEAAETPVAAAPVMATESEPEPEPTEYAYKFHHTTTGSSDGGKSLVLCPGQVMNFDSCSVGSVDIPYHGKDNGRHTYWNMFEEPSGDIVCVKNGKSYKYKADSMIVDGSCG